MRQLSLRLFAVLSVALFGIALQPAHAAVVPAESLKLVVDSSPAQTEAVQWRRGGRGYGRPRPYGYRPYRPARIYRPMRVRPAYVGGYRPVYNDYDPCKRRIQVWNGYRYIIRRVRVCR